MDTLAMFSEDMRVKKQCISEIEESFRTIV